MAACSRIVPEAAARYAPGARRSAPVEVWKASRQVPRVPAGSRLRVVAEAPFVLHWSVDEWRTTADTTASGTPLGFSYVNLAIAPDQPAPVRFTFLWTDGSRWEGKDYAVDVSSR